MEGGAGLICWENSAVTRGRGRFRGKEEKKKDRKKSLRGGTGMKAPGGEELQIRSPSVLRKLGRGKKINTGSGTFSKGKGKKNCW